MTPLQMLSEEHKKILEMIALIREESSLPNKELNQKEKLIKKLRLETEVKIGQIIRG